MRVAAVCLISSLALVAACSKPKSADGAAAGAASAPVAPAALLAPPQPKIGLWEVTMTMDGGPGMSVTGQMCLDEKTRQAAYNTSPQPDASRDCDQPKLTAQGGGAAFETTCRTDGRTTTVKGVMTGDFTSAYTMDTTITTNPPVPGAPAEMHMKSQARYLGPCQGQPPGQLSGMRIGGLG